MILIDVLSKTYLKKYGINENLFDENTKAIIYDFKKEIDNFVNKYSFNGEKLIMDISNHFQNISINPNDQTCTLYREYEKLILNPETPTFFININREKYSKLIEDYDKQYNSKYILINDFNFTDKFKYYPEYSNLLQTAVNLKILGSNALKSIVNESQLKKIVAKYLKYNSIPYIYNYCSYPFIADFLLFPNEDNKIIIQVKNKILIN